MDCVAFWFPGPFLVSRECNPVLGSVAGHFSAAGGNPEFALFLHGIFMNVGILPYCSMHHFSHG